MFDSTKRIRRKIKFSRKETKHSVFGNFLTHTYGCNEQLVRLLKLCLVPGNFERKLKKKKKQRRNVEERKNERNIKNKFKANKYFLYIPSNSLHFF